MDQIRMILAPEEIRIINHALIEVKTDMRILYIDPYTTTRKSIAIDAQFRDIIVDALHEVHKSIEQAGGDHYGPLPIKWLPNLISYLQNPQDYPYIFIPCPRCGKRIHPRLQICKECEIESRRNGK